MQISSTVLCRLPIHKASRNWFVTHLLYLNYLVNAVNYSSLKSSSVKCIRTDRHFDFLDPSVLRMGGPKITIFLEHPVVFQTGITFLFSCLLVPCKNCHVISIDVWWISCRKPFRHLACAAVNWFGIFFH